MSGFPGSGKSTLVKAIAKVENVMIVDHDVVKSALMKSIADKDLDIQITGQISYDIDWALIEYYLSLGQNVILDSPCLYEEQVQKGLELANRFNATYKYIECYVEDYDLINHRLRTRERRISQITQAYSLEAFEYTIKNSKKPEQIQILRVDTKKSITYYLPIVMDYIKK